jgi:hypothetical protein
MKEMHKFQIATAIFVSAFFTSLGYEIKELLNANSFITSLLIVSISLIVSALLSNFTTTLLIKMKLIRRIVFKDNWIEGFWFNVDIGGQSEPSVFNAEAITEIKFIDPSLGYKTIGFRIKEGKEIFTVSQHVILFGADNLYVNFTASSAKGPFRPIIAAGYFFRSPGSKYLNTYDGVVAELDGTSSFRQRATKMNDKDVKELRKRFGNDWVRKILMDKVNEEDLVNVDNV